MNFDIISKENKETLTTQVSSFFFFFLNYYCLLKDGTEIQTGLLHTINKTIMKKQKLITAI